MWCKHNTNSICGTTSALWQRSSPSPRTRPLAPQFFHWPVGWNAAGSLAPCCGWARRVRATRAVVFFSLGRLSSCLLQTETRLCLQPLWEPTHWLPVILHLLPKPTHPCDNCHHQIANHECPPSSICKICSFHRQMSWRNTKACSCPHNALMQEHTHTHILVKAVCVSPRCPVLAKAPWEIKEFCRSAVTLRCRR